MQKLLTGTSGLLEVPLVVIAIMARDKLTLIPNKITSIQNSSPTIMKRMHPIVHLVVVSTTFSVDILNAYEFIFSNYSRIFWR